MYHWAPTAVESEQRQWRHPNDRCMQCQGASVLCCHISLMLVCGMWGTKLPRQPRWSSVAERIAPPKATVAIQAACGQQTYQSMGLKPAQSTGKPAALHPSDNPIPIQASSAIHQPPRISHMGVPPYPRLQLNSQHAAQQMEFSTVASR